ncbi:hypothetical protein GIB67_011495 [Kingdonia uniflora]|uniref:Uncharacterized protein n=1 Tax=Kingdonia uniflora TaxID=39325 RepID=A0A7J7NM59_9MAGN|nr:hypothetical protein GIB67_011495 [Kingdonia uniflora]
MVKTRSMVLEERIASEVQRLKLKYIGDRSLEMAIPAPVPPTYQGLSGEEAAKAEENFNYKWRFYFFVLTGEERWACLCTLAEDRVMGSYAGKDGRLAIKTVELLERIFGSLGYDAELPMRRARGSGSRRWEYNNVARGKIDSTTDSHLDIEGRNSPVESIFKMGRSPVDEVSTFGRTNESDSGWEGGLDQFPSFPGQLVSYPPGSDTFREYCKAKGVIGGKWGKCAEFTGMQFRGCMVAEGEEYFYLLADLEAEKQDRGIDESITLEYFDGDVRSMKSIVERKKSLLDEVTEEETELELVLGELGLSRKNRVESSPSCLGDLAQYRRTGIRAEEGEELGRYLMLKGYSQEEVNAIKADTYAEEEEEEAEVVREMSLRINDLESKLARERETSKALLSAQAELKVELDASRVHGDHGLMYNREFAEQFDRIKEANENREDPYAKADFRLEKLNQATERAENLQRQVDALAMQGRIRELESDVSRIQGHVQRGNANLRECQHKMDATLIREKVLGGEIKAKDLLVKRKDEFLKDLPAREELNAELGVFWARVVELQGMNLVESAQYITKLKEDAIYHDKVDADINAWKDTCASLKVRHERLKARFAKAVISDISQSALLSVIVAYFVEEVKRLESE